MEISKSKIDRAGVALAKDTFRDADEWVECEDVLDEYRKAHLQPLTETTLELPRHAFRAFLLMLELFEKQKIEPMICFRPPGDVNDHRWVGLVTDRDLLVKEYYCEDLPRVLDKPS